MTVPVQLLQNFSITTVPFVKFTIVMFFKNNFDAEMISLKFQELKHYFKRIFNLLSSNKFRTFNFPIVCFINFEVTFFRVHNILFPEMLSIRTSAYWGSDIGIFKTNFSTVYVWMSLALYS